MNAIGTGVFGAVTDGGAVLKHRRVFSCQSEKKITPFALHDNRHDTSVVSNDSRAGGRKVIVTTNAFPQFRIGKQEKVVDPIKNVDENLKARPKA